MFVFIGLDTFCKTQFFTNYATNKAKQKNKGKNITQLVAWHALINKPHSEYKLTTENQKSDKIVLNRK